MERFRREVEQSEFDVGNGSKLKITCSIGFSCFPFYQDKPEAYNWEHVVEIADQCLYAAKKTQRNAWVGAYGIDRPDSEGAGFEQVHTNVQAAVEQGRVKLLRSIDEAKPLKWE